jgi:hypothetical protein
MAIIVSSDSWARNISCVPDCIGSDGGRSMKLLASGGNSYRRGADSLVSGGRGNGSSGGTGGGAHGVGPKTCRGASGTGSGSKGRGDTIDIDVVVPHSETQGMGNFHLKEGKVEKTTDKIVM